MERGLFFIGLHAGLLSVNPEQMPDQASFKQMASTSPARKVPGTLTYIRKAYLALVLVRTASLATL